MTTPPVSQRLTAARAEFDKATRTTRLAAIAARDALHRRAHRRRRILAVAVVAAIVVTVGLAITSILLPVRTSDARGVVGRDAQALAAASAAVTTMLTADPKHAQRYADSVIALSTGDHRDRLTAARGELVTEISGQQEASTGVVLSAGLITDPSDAPDATADVLLVAEATNPALIGGDPAQKRMPIVVTMRLDDGAWKVEKAGLR